MLQKKEIRALQENVRAARKGLDVDCETFESVVVDSFAMLDWFDTASEVLALALEERTAKEWNAMSDMFYAFVGMPLEDALREFCRSDVEEDCDVA